MRMLHVDTETQLFQQSPFGADHGILSIDVHLVEWQWLDETSENWVSLADDHNLYLPSGSHLFYVMEHIDDIPNASGILFDFSSKIRASHGRDLHRSTHKRRTVEITMKQHLTGGHCRLKSTEEVEDRRALGQTSTYLR